MVTWKSSKRHWTWVGLPPSLWSPCQQSAMSLCLPYIPDQKRAGRIMAHSDPGVCRAWEWKLDAKNSQSQLKAKMIPFSDLISAKYKHYSGYGMKRNTAFRGLRSIWPDYMGSIILVCTCKGAKEFWHCFVEFLARKLCSWTLEAYKTIWNTPDHQKDR